METTQAIAESPAPKKDRKLRFNYSWIVRHLPFILYLAFLALIYIANGYYADRNFHKISETRKELNDLHWQYLILKSDLMYRSKFSEVSMEVAPMGLKVPALPPTPVLVDSVGK